MFKILKNVLFNSLRNKVMIGYTFILFILSWGIIYLQGDIEKSVASLLSVVLLLIPLVSIIIATINYYNSQEFIELLMTHPIKRRTIFLAHYLGIAWVLALTFLVGVGLPLLIAGGFDISVMYLLATGFLLTFIFTGLAFLASVFSKDKARGIGLSLILWFYFSIVYDAVVMSALVYLSDYPLEKTLMFMTALNPVDLSRIIILLNLDISALMGYTGALYKKFFGSSEGIIYSFGFLFLWVIIPVWKATKKFIKKDF
ncbi:MAG: ABC transporter permease subunit [Bacteroidetes bacterium]|nr:ABC transporter permease subunit [Bacteroidota bacterium]